MTSKVCVEYGARSVFEMMTACRVFRTLFWSGSCCHLCNFLADNWYRLLNRTRGQNSIWNSYNSLIKTLHFNLFFQETLLFRFKMVFFVLTLKENLIVLIFDAKFFIVLFCPRFLFNHKHLWQYLKFLAGNTDNTTVPAILLSVFTLLLIIPVGTLHGSVFVVILPDGVVISGFGLVVVSLVVVSFGVRVEKTVLRKSQYKRRLSSNKLKIFILNIYNYTYISEYRE